VTPELRLVLLLTEPELGARLEELLFHHTTLPLALDPVPLTPQTKLQLPEESTHIEELAAGVRFWFVNVAWGAFTAWVAENPGDPVGLLTVVVSVVDVVGRAFWI
jgi:hypothetical protein